MNGRFVLKCVAVCAASTLGFAGSASAQFGPQVKVSNVIEGGVGGVSAARCGNTIVVGFADAEPNRPNTFDGFAVSKNGGASFTDGGTLPVPPSNDFGINVLGSNFDNPLGQSNPSVACANSNLFYYASVYSPTGGIVEEIGICATVME